MRDIELVSEVEKYEGVSCKICMRLSKMGGGSVRWLFTRRMVDGSFLGSGLMYWFSLSCFHGKVLDQWRKRIIEV